MKNFAIIGFGGLGKTHFLNLIKIEEKRKDIRLAAICNADIESITKSIKINLGNVSLDDIDFSRYNLYTDYKEMIEKEDLDFVFIALPTYLHCEAAVYCLDHGVNVYTEKPMAITLTQCEMMIEASKRSGKKLMVGHCLRFTGEYELLKELTENGKYGKPIKAEFYRRSALPTWSFDNWLLKDDKSGSCIVDMHVHDVDQMVWLFGAPDTCMTMSTHQMADYESTYSLYKCGETAVMILTDWGIHSSFPFSYGYNVTFEDAYVVSHDGKVTVYTNESSFEPEINSDDCYYKEVNEFIEAVVDGKPFKTADVESVYETMKIVFNEKEISKKK